MQERDRRPGERPEAGGDIPAPTEGDYSFPDWDNPEDELEDAPEGYYDDKEDDLGEGYIPDPDDPDYDLSEAAGYAGYDSERRPGVPQWLIVVASLLLILALLLPLLLRFN